MKKLLFSIAMIIGAFFAGKEADAAVYVTNYTPLQYSVALSNGTFMGIPANIGGTTVSPAVLGIGWWVRVGPYEPVVVSASMLTNASVGIYPPMTSTYKVNAFNPDGMGINIYISITP